MTGEIIRPMGGGEMSPFTGRDIRKVVRKAQLDGAKIMADERLHELNIDLTCRLDDYRLDRARERPHLAELLARDVVAFHDNTLRDIANRDSIFRKLF